MGVVKVKLVLESEKEMGWLHLENVESWFSIFIIVHRTEGKTVKETPNLNRYTPTKIPRLRMLAARL